MNHFDSFCLIICYLIFVYWEQLVSNLNPKVLHKQAGNVYWIMVEMFWNR